MSELLESKEVTLKGVPISPGVAIGHLFFLARDQENVFEFNISPSDTKREKERYLEALQRTRQDIKRLQMQLKAESAEEAILILDSQLQILQEPSFTKEVELEIENSQKNAEFVLQQAINRFKEHFKTLNDLFFAERFNDLNDLFQRIFSYLRNSEYFSLAEVPMNSIICADELNASDVAEAKAQRVITFVTVHGGATSHAAIVAKAKGIPYVTNLNMKEQQESIEGLVIIDGIKGEVIINPSDHTLERYEQIRKGMEKEIDTLSMVTRWPAQTVDGYTIRLLANVDSLNEAELVHQYGGEGVGLFRSEYMFLQRNEVPGEEEQYQIYRELVEKMNGLPVVIRTFDFGGDKILQNHSVPKKNSFLGCRAKRFLFKEPEYFRSQVRAIWRASVHGNVSILFPMIATLAELMEAKSVVEEIKRTMGFNHFMRIGCMIEVPSACMIVDHLAKECDFLSIGTNDLVQYSLAVDRSDHQFIEYYEGVEAGIIRLIKIVVNAADQQRIPVTICGEIANDPRFTALFLGLGVQKLSVAPRFLPVIKNRIRQSSIVDAVRLAEKALTLQSAKSILDLVIRGDGIISTSQQSAD